MSKTLIKSMIFVFILLSATTVHAQDWLTKEVKNCGSETLWAWTNFPVKWTELPGNTKVTITCTSICSPFISVERNMKSRPDFAQISGAFHSMTVKKKKNGTIKTDYGLNC